MNTSSSNGICRLLGWTGLAGAVVFVTLIVVGGLAYPGYSHVDQMISELGGVDATQPWIQNIGFVLFGLAVVGVAAALIIDAGKVFVGAILLAGLGAFGLVAEGLVHCDSGCKGATTEGAVHLGFGLLGFACGIVATFLLARRWRRDRRWSGLAGFARWCSWLAVATFVLFFVSDAFPDISGLAQRAFAAVLVAFVAGTSWWLASGRTMARAAISEAAISV